jgi:predicted DNA-binding transcriptional regulator AlpA
LVDRTGPFPNQELLTVKEARVMLGMSRSQFARVRRSPARRFPRPVVVAHSEQGRPILRYRKYQVQAFIDLLKEQERQKP